jgi:hypothetical protein
MEVRVSKHHTAIGWSNVNKKHRARLAATLPTQCMRCGQIVTADMKWDVGHRVDLAQGGNSNDVGVEHRSCNRRAGGRAGARATNARRKQRRDNPDDPRIPAW